MSEPLDIRAYRDGDESQILKLFSSSFGGRELPPAYWRWRFLDNPRGRGVIQLAWDHKVLAAHFAVTCLLMSIEGQTCPAGLSGTTMTDPAYRGRGLFPVLARRTYQQMAESGMGMIWGFPNSASHRIFTGDLAWKDIYEIPSFRLRLEPPKHGAADPHCVRELSGVDERFDGIWAQVRREYDILVHRDSVYLRWRYFRNPAEKYRLVAWIENDVLKGFMVFKLYHHELQVVDLLLAKADVEIGEGLMRYIIKQGPAAGAESVNLWLNPAHPLHPALERIGFRPEGPVTYFGGRILNPEWGASLYDYRRWHVTMGDSDVF